MPMLSLTMPEGVLAEPARVALSDVLLATLLTWEGAPDNAFFRSLAWCHINEVPSTSFRNAEDQLPRFRVDVTVPEGALSERRKAGLVAQVTADVAAAVGLADTDLLRIWVLVHEQPEGSWGAGGQIVRFAELRALAAGTAR